MNCGIAVFPSKDIQDFANSYRKRYDPHYDRVAPHMTVREPETWSAPELSSAAEQLDQVTRSLTPFDIHFNRFSTYYPAMNVIYLALSDLNPMVHLYEAICTGALVETNRLYRFNPHLTIGQELGSDELHDVLSSVRKTEIDLTSHIDRVHLLYQTENQAWTVYQTFLLRGTD